MEVCNSIGRQKGLIVYVYFDDIFVLGDDPCACAATGDLVHLPPHGGLLIRGPGNGAPPPSKSSPYAIIYNPRAETKHTSKVYDAAPLNDRLGELIGAVIFVLMNHGCFTKLGPLPGFNFFTSIH